MWHWARQPPDRQALCMHSGGAGEDAGDHERADGTVARTRRPAELLDGWPSPGEDKVVERTASRALDEVTGRSALSRHFKRRAKPVEAATVLRLDPAFADAGEGYGAGCDGAQEDAPRRGHGKFGTRSPRAHQCGCSRRRPGQPPVRGHVGAVRRHHGCSGDDRRTVPLESPGCRANWRRRPHAPGRGHLRWSRMEPAVVRRVSGHRQDRRLPLRSEQMSATARPPRRWQTGSGTHEEELCGMLNAGRINDVLAELRRRRRVVWPRPVATHQFRRRELAHSRTYRPYRQAIVPSSSPSHAPIAPPEADEALGTCLGHTGIMVGPANAHRRDEYCACRFKAGAIAAIRAGLLAALR